MNEKKNDPCDESINHKLIQMESNENMRSAFFSICDKVLICLKVAKKMQKTYPQNRLTLGFVGILLHTLKLSNKMFNIPDSFVFPQEPILFCESLFEMNSKFTVICAIDRWPNDLIKDLSVICERILEIKTNIFLFSFFTSNCQHVFTYATYPIRAVINGLNSLYRHIRLSVENIKFPTELISSAMDNANVKEFAKQIQCLKGCK